MISDFLHTCLIQWTHHSVALCKAASTAGLVHYLLSALEIQKEKVFDEVRINKHIRTFVIGYAAM